ncbi:MAG: hypothetical protein DMF19_08180 [Verrucomicrobia bacterium]|nr:MAG: hypothetical protein DMF19_08180 [Verrucomicrobiota bacterium]
MLRYLRILTFALAIFPLAARACDLCGCYTPQVESMPKEKVSLSGFYTAIAEQFTHFGSLQFDDRDVANPTGQRLESSITQFVIGYGINDRLAVQFNAPFIYREFRRPEGLAIDEGNVSGIGDVSLLAKAVLWHFASTARREFNLEGKNPVAIEHESDCTCSIVALAGLKFPTGDPSRLKEEFHEVEIPGAAESGIHGHDLTLGTGSYDGIFGAQSSLRYKNFFAEANGQFTLRGDGAHDYHFANDVTWSAGPGYYLVRKRDTLVGFQCVASGESKDVDRFQGRAAEDTGVTSVFIGPRVIASHEQISGEVAAEFPGLMNTTAFQAVPDYRLRASIAVSW